MKFQFNPFSVYTLAFLSMIVFSSCGDIVQDLHLNKDGSGTLETSIDVGELMGMAKGFENMGSDQDSFTDDIIFDTMPVAPAPPKDAITLLMEKITDPSHDQDFDTTMSFLSIMPDSIKQKETRLDLVAKMFVRMKSPAKSANLTFGILMKFDDTKQLRELINYMESLNETSGIVSGAAPMGMDKGNFLVFDADMKAGWIKVDTFSYKGFAEEMGMGMSPDSVTSGEDIGMMEMVFGNSKLKSVIYVPGEVLSCSNPDAILTKDNKVIIEYPMMDVIRKGKVDGFTVYFKP